MKWLKSFVALAASELDKEKGIRDTVRVQTYDNICWWPQNVVIYSSPQDQILKRKKWSDVCVFLCYLNLMVFLPSVGGAENMKLQEVIPPLFLIEDSTQGKRAETLVKMV